MDDILSGGKIDQSTSGPIPSSRDDRDRDILLEQKERQDQDAIGGTQFSPRPQPPPPIPSPVEVAPPLPVLPSFDFNIAGSAFEETREIARQTTVDILKNVTINGQKPAIDGSSISFNIPQQPPASEAFMFQGIMVPANAPAPAPPRLQQPQIEQPEPPQEIQSFVISPPRSQQPQQAEELPPVIVEQASVGSISVPATVGPLAIRDGETQEQYQARIDTLAKEATDERVARPRQEERELAETETEEKPATSPRSKSKETLSLKLGEDPSGDFGLLEGARGGQAPSRQSVETGEKTPPSDGPREIAPSQNFSASPENGGRTMERRPESADEADQRMGARMGSSRSLRQERDGEESSREGRNKSEGEKKDARDEASKQYTEANTAFPPLTIFYTCVSGQPKIYMIPAFGPYEDEPEDLP